MGGSRGIPPRKIPQATTHRRDPPAQLSGSPRVEQSDGGKVEEPGRGRCAERRMDRLVLAGFPALPAIAAAEATVVASLRGGDRFRQPAGRCGIRDAPVRRGALHRVRPDDWHCAAKIRKSPSIEGEKSWGTHAHAELIEIESALRCSRLARPPD